MASTQKVLPVLFTLTNKRYQPVGLYGIEDNLSHYLILLFGSWIMAALMEEMVFRGYVLNRLVDLMGEGKKETGIALLVSSLFFAFGHEVFEPLVLVLTVFHGLLLGALYLLAAKNLWFSIIAHGMGITVTITLAFFGIF